LLPEPTGILHSNQPPAHLQVGLSENVLVQVVGVHAVGRGQPPLDSGEKLTGVSIRVDLPQRVEVQENERATRETERRED